VQSNRICRFSESNDDAKTSQSVDDSLDESLKSKGKKKKMSADAILPEVNLDQVGVLQTSWRRCNESTTDLCYSISNHK